MRATDSSDFPAPQQSNKGSAIEHTVHRMYAIADHLALQPSSKNCSREMKTTFATSLRTMRVEESFHNAGVKVCAEHAWKFFKNKLTQTKKIPLKIEELRTTPLPWGRRGHDNPQLIFATGITPRKNEPSTTRIAGKVVFVGCEWRPAATLFESASYDKHLVNPMHLQEMLG